MRSLAVLICAALIAPPAFAKDAVLPPGKPAGVQRAMSQNAEVWILVGTAALATGVGIVLFAMEKGSSSSSSTSQ